MSRIRAVEGGIVTFGPVDLKQDFTTVDTFLPPELQPSGDTPMGAAIVRGLELLRDRKSLYKSNGISYCRPWIFLITDGAPTDDVTAAAAQVREGERNCSPLTRRRRSAGEPENPDGWAMV